MVFCIVFPGNKYPNENQMIRGNVEQMALNVVVNTSTPNPIANINLTNYPDNDINVETQQEIRSIQQETDEQINDQLNSSNLIIPIPTTIDGLIEYIALNGDEHEEKIISQIAQMNERSLFR